MDDEYVLITFAVQVLCWKVKPLKIEDGSSRAVVRNVRES
jgi:hypothetical protein